MFNTYISDLAFPESFKIIVKVRVDYVQISTILQKKKCTLSKLFSREIWENATRMCFIQVIIISLSYLFSLGSKSRHSNRTAQKSRFTYFNSKTAGSDLQLLLRYYYSHFCALVRTHFVNCFDKQFNFKVCMHKQVLVCSQKTFACSN